MEDFGSLWAFESESIEELKQKLLHSMIELESANKLKMELFDLLKVVYHERDELREALMKVLHKLATTSSPSVPEDNVIPPVIRESLIMLPNTKANSSTTESNSLSHGSSAVDSFLDAVSSPDFSNMNVADSRNVGFFNSEKTQRDPASVVIENLIKGKALPQKGKLLQSVMEAGPLLQTLLVAGPLPCWRNPPPIQPIKLPPFSIKDLESPALYSNSSGFPMKALETCSSASMMNFAINNAVSWQSTSTASFNNQVPASKRQRL
ncbi:uncharacterized protein LOC114732602 [Neltuma alba]|uniref:uncharacterized protein LOC114732602 n=1 Tax=Neltuma alba TaxID=207710 RepID=UPI0010A5846F|nr:uncharacterized protein LOC114732602 [Prosopis alba]